MIMSLNKPHKHSSPKPPTGEAWVWLSSLGLTLGLGMVIAILGLIFYQGMRVFWPGRVMQLTLRAGTDTTLSSPSSLIGGILAKEQQKKGGLKAVMSDTDTAANREWHLFVGNKDVYGLSYLYIDHAAIARVDYPEDIIRIDREEYGNAIGYPVALKLNGQETILFGSPQFDPLFQSQLDEIAERRRTIKQIEKKQIGKINHALEKLRIKEAKSTLQSDPGNHADKLAMFTEKKQSLQARYESLAATARELRSRQDQHHLKYRLISGQERTLSLGKIISYTYPNRQGVIDRCRNYVHNLWLFVSEDPREANTEGGIFPAIFGTFVMTIIMSLIVSPLGVLAAIYLVEYARQGMMVRIVRIAINNLAGVPSIVFGVFGLGFFIYYLGAKIDHTFFSATLPTPTFGTGGVLWASLTLALLTVPVVIVATEEGLRSVPRGIREGALACGASKWQAIQRVVLPAAAPGILTGVILAMARGAGEVAPLMLVGVVKLAPTLPLNTTYPYFHLEQKFMHLGFHIYDLGFQSPDSDAAIPMVFATTFFLILLVVIMNLTAIIIRERLRKKYSAGSY